MESVYFYPEGGDVKVFRNMSFGAISDQLKANGGFDEEKWGFFEWLYREIGNHTNFIVGYSFFVDAAISKDGKFSREQTEEIKREGERVIRERLNIVNKRGFNLETSLRWILGIGKENSLSGTLAERQLNLLRRVYEARKFEMKHGEDLAKINRADPDHFYMGDKLDIVITAGYLSTQKQLKDHLS